MATRRELRDDQWDRIKGIVLGKKGDGGRHGEDNRLFVDAVLLIMRTGAPWRLLPKAFGNPNSVFQRYNRWAKAGVWEKIFRILADDPDFDYLMIDSITARVHQYSGGAKRGLKKRKPSGAAEAG